MKAIILAGGFATRLMPLTKHIPKALLPVDGKPIIDFMVEKMLDSDRVDSIIVSTNAKFENHFRYWQKCIAINASKPVSVITEPTQKEEEKLGAIGALDYVIREGNLEGEELLIVAGDNLFEFDLEDFIRFYEEKGQNPVVAFCDLKDKEVVKEKYGVGILDDNLKVIDFQEKSSEPRSALASTGCYLYPSSISDLIKEFLSDSTSNQDAPGYFVDWVRSRTDMYGFTFDQAWYDIGSFESYDKVNEDYKGKVTIK